MRNMHTCLLCASHPVGRLAYAGDTALFVIAFRTGSRVSDITKLLATQILRLLSSYWLVLNFHFTKTLRDGAAHDSLLAPDKDTLETYALAATILSAQAADSCRWERSTGYIFPGMQASGDRTPNRLARPLSGKAMAARFKERVKHTGLAARYFTDFSFRVGCAVTQTIECKNSGDYDASEREVGKY